ncbi:MAG TPA: DsrE/DsrF/DrsH-like family protein [Tenuifilaceae bacterium]|nr:DsrE/DsrF/DrsH-like family protein [Tenuifilaceae bacterium]
MNAEFEKQLEELKKKVSKLEKGQKDKMTMVVFSGELDKLMAAMIIATGATAMDMEVKLFFTFWAIAALRDPKKSVKGKTFMSKMFGFMLPKGAKKVKLSKMNMGGMGKAMLEGLMKKKGVKSLPQLFEAAAELGVEINVCEMSMDLMGFKREELIDYPNLNICGVGTFLSDAEESKIQLFI